jgi:hypothetical protein
VLPQAPLLLSLVAKELRNREPAHRLPQGVRPRTNHARNRWRHFRTQRNRSPAFVFEVVELSDDLLPALLRVEIEGLKRRAVVFDEAETARYVTPTLKQPRALREGVGIKIAKTGKRSA